MQSTPESGGRAGYDGAKRKLGSNDPKGTGSRRRESRGAFVDEGYTERDEKRGYSRLQQPETVADGSVQAGISTGTLQNGGVGLAPFHDWDSRIPADLKARIEQASDGIKDGSIEIDLPQ